MGRQLKGGEVIELVGDVGGGKTTFVQGLAKGLGCDADVVSPTFTISRIYPARDDLRLYHFDFYRLEGHDITTDEMEEAVSEANSIVAVEWAGNGEVHLPEKRVVVKLEPGGSESDREVEISTTDESLEYIIEGIR